MTLSTMMTRGVRVIQKQHLLPAPHPVAANPQLCHSKAQVWSHLPVVLTLILGTQGP